MRIFDNVPHFLHVDGLLALVLAWMSECGPHIITTGVSSCPQIRMRRQ